MKSVALYDPYLDTLGGGEKHILSILKVLEQEGFQLNIFWNENLQLAIEDRFNFDFKKNINWLPNIFKKKSPLVKLQILKNFDYFFYVTDGSYFFSTAKNNFVFCMIPNKNLYKQSLLNKIKTSNYRFISNSKFTQNWLKKWEVNSEVIYPYINNEFIDLEVESLKKEKIILSVGRFYRHLHSKQQSKLINLFNKLKHEHKLLKNFRLILAGGLKEEDKAYFEELTSSVKDKSNILFKPNLSYSKLIELYKKSLVYIHMTGYGVDENKNPEQVEHLGITPLEALASGCLTFCYNAGGIKEIIDNRKTGFLFTTQEELINLLEEILASTKKQNQVKNMAKSYIINNFSYDKFKKRVKEIIL